MKNRLSFILLITFFVFSCNTKKENPTNDAPVKETQHEPAHQKEDKHWTYGGETGPEYWAEIEKQSDCDGQRQSPINIIDVDLREEEVVVPIDIHYSAEVKIHDITNNGHSIQYDFARGDFINYGDDKYDLKQIHFHEPSEHTINGVRFPLEMHLVHVSKDNKIAVLAVLAKEGESSEPYAFLEKYLPISMGDTKLINTEFDLNKSLPEDKGYYTYSGSLTTPPCTEQVTWVIYKTPVFISLDQVKQLQKLMPKNNYRNEQPLNGRIVKQYGSH